MAESYYLCIDLKSFYASVECVERGLDPMTTDLVVADPDRTDKTICLAVSPSLKAKGVKNRCRVFEIPKGMDYIMAPPRMQKYIDYAAEIYGVYLEYIAPEDIHVYSIDEAFLDVTHYLWLYNMTAKELAVKYGNKATITITVRYNKSKYTFSDINDFLKNSSLLTEKIEYMKINIEIKRKDSYGYDENNMEFNNEPEFALSDDVISFDFNEPAGYYTLKNQLQTLIRNHQLNYSLFAKTTLLTPLSILSYAFICIYTNLMHIVYPTIVQYLITIFCAVLALFPLSLISRKIKRFIFPRYEFEFGVNTYKNQRSKDARNILGVGIILAFVVGIIVNIVSNFLI